MDSREMTDGIFVPLDQDLSDAILQQNSNICQICPKGRTNIGQKFRKDGISFEIGEEEEEDVFVKSKKLAEPVLASKSVEIEVHRPQSFKISHHLLHLHVQDDGNSAGTVTSAKTLRKRRIASIFQHYYPEGGWGYVVLLTSFLVHLLSNGLPYGLVLILPTLSRRFHVLDITTASLFGVLSASVSLFVSPFVIAVCRRKSTRLTSVVGGLIVTLGCLFTSFATQSHQVFLSYGIMVGVGIGMTRDPASLMVGQYFKRRRSFVEIFLVSSAGIGIALVSYFINFAVESMGWRHGLQAMTGLSFLLFILGTFYRSASLYHPQRRAILHLKSQKRKIKNKDKEKNKIQDDRPPFFDFATLKSKTVQILLCSIAIGSFGLNMPLFNIVHQATKDGLKGKQLVWLQAHLGISWAVGCFIFGAIVVNNSTDCRISKQYLCQGALFLTGISILAFTVVEGSNGYVMFAWIYGIFNGGYNYTLKMYINEKVRARNFARAWGFAQFSMAVPSLIGIPVSGYIDANMGRNPGYVFSGGFVILGAVFMILIDVHKRQVRRHKRHCKNNHRTLLQQTDPLSKTDPNSLQHLEQIEQLDEIEADRNSFTDQDDILPPMSLLSHQRSFVYDDMHELMKKRETLGSDEGIDDLDMPEEYMMDDFDYVDNITSCNKVENYLMLSEYEQNLIKETEGPHGDGHRKWTNRKWSMFKSPAMPTINSESEDVSGTTSGIETQKSVSDISENFFTNFSRKSFKNKLRFSNTNEN